LTSAHEGQRERLAVPCPAGRAVDSPRRSWGECIEHLAGLAWVQGLALAVLGPSENPASAAGSGHVVAWERRCVVSFIAVMDHASALIPALRSPTCSRFRATRQAGEQNRACSRRGMNGVPHRSQALVSATTVRFLRERLHDSDGRCYRAGQDPSPGRALPGLGPSPSPVSGVVNAGVRCFVPANRPSPCSGCPAAAHGLASATPALVLLPVILRLFAIHLSFTFRSVDRRLGPVTSAAMAGTRPAARYRAGGMSDGGRP
jgi:hypothetical protein